jgi:hypothetical protein
VALEASEDAAREGPASGVPNDPEDHRARGLPSRVEDEPQVGVG